MDQILWLLLFPAFLHPLNLRIIRQRQPRAPQQPYNNRGTAVHGDNAGGHSQDGTERSWARCWRDQGWTDRRTGCHSHLSDRSGAKGPAADPPVPLLPAEPSPDPGTEPLPDGAMRVKARSGKAFPHRPRPVNLRLHREAKQTPGRAESAARPVPGAGPASPPSRLEQGKDKCTQPGHRDRSQLEELLPLHGTAALELLWHKLGKGDMWGDIHPSCCSTEGVTGG